MMTSYNQWKKENWDLAHLHQDITALTGTGMLPHLKTLCVEDLINKESTVLCVGVGTGSWINELAKAVKCTWALDISKEAYKNLRRPVKFIFDSKSLPDDTFDLALSLWVAPHMSNHDFEEQLKEVIRSLVPNGIFAIHYKEPLEVDSIVDNREGASDEWEVARRAGMLRRRKHFEDMVVWAGGRFSEVKLERISHYQEIIEVSAHVRK